MSCSRTQCSDACEAPTLGLGLSTLPLIHCAPFILCTFNVPPGREARSVTCLATYVSLTSDPGVVSAISARSHTFVETDYEIFSMVILLLLLNHFKKDCCQLHAKVCARSTG